MRQMDIDPGRGVGLIELGMSPAQVKGVLGEDLVYERWMGGNLNDSLYYPGIVVAFDEHDGHGPLDHGRVTDIWIDRSFGDVEFQGMSVFSLTKSRLEAELAARGIGFEYLGGYLILTSLGVEFLCEDDGHISRVNVCQAREMG